MPLIPDHNVTWKCAKCGVYMRVYTGDSDDMTLPDVEAVQCYSCGHLELTYEEYDFRVIHGVEVTQETIREHAHYEVGTPLPTTQGA